MDGSILVAAVAIAAIALVVAMNARFQRDDGSVLREGLRIELQAAQHGIQGQVELLARSVSELRSDLSRSLGATEQQLATQAGTTHRTLTDLARQLGTLGE
ncbi:MAG: hypothetical protein M3R37_02165, partial [Actinomycetota bacterium]|nr:hypothetical protein [Actinomycetota bacterium]